MGAEIHLKLESDKNDERKLAPFLGRQFQSEITQGRLWDGRKPFLTKLESELLEANYYEELDDEGVELINPKDLILVIEKVKKYLFTNCETLPFEIVIDHYQMNSENLPSKLMINNSKCWIQGDSLYYDVGSKFKIVNNPLEPNKVEQWFEFKEQININGSKFYLKKITRFEKFKDSFEEIITFCKYAVKRKEKIYWLYNH